MSVPTLVDRDGSSALCWRLVQHYSASLQPSSVHYYGTAVIGPIVMIASLLMAHFRKLIDFILTSKLLLSLSTTHIIEFHAQKPSIYRHYFI
ncbi:hypothetical protein J6590_042758 [Homalodisca vitripennis]|nr:hypothetical protein J6590_042758 [Homalodisca vitripennis]